MRILFITSNGTGLGHLTRSMAIARRLGPSFEPLVLTLSAAAPVVRELGFPVEYVASYGTPGAGSDWRWSRRLRARLRTAIAEAAPRVIVFDGAHPYQALVDALGTARGTRAVWCRRPMWRPGSNRGALERSGFFDAVLEPGELADAEDRGPTVAMRDEAHRVGPIVFGEDQELVPRADAERELGLEPGKVNVLVQLGQGPDVAGAVDRCLRHLSGRPEVQVAALSSTMAKLLAVPDGIVHLRSTYPMSRYFAAFDLAVSAAGYNAYHELIRFRVPALYVPMPRLTDDQAARARYAEQAGIGLGTDGPDSDRIEALLDQLLDPERRASMRERLGELRMPNGAEEAARWLGELATAEGGTGRGGPGRWRRWLRQPLRSARRAAPFAARLPVHFAAFVKQTIVRRPPRTVVLALGVAEGALERELEDAFARTPDPPGRVLVVTDSLEFGPLLRAGVGFEHVPAKGEAQAKLGGADYHAFLRQRLALILGERPRPRRALAIGDADERLVAEIASPGA
jgi:UDP-N-acetylglucosamine--N-acetylmuramyl-(pentapeptide) pyrophosphoryl-undecaprenol N-acetylglucosamine transferase